MSAMMQSNLQIYYYPDQNTQHRSSEDSENPELQNSETFIHCLLLIAALPLPVLPDQFLSHP